MKSGWVSAAAAVLATAGWATAQAPVSSGMQTSAGAPPAAELGAGPAAPSSAALFGDAPDNGPPPYRLWVSGDFLVWKVPNGHLPGLAASVPVGVIHVNTDDRVIHADGSITDTRITGFAPVSISSSPSFSTGDSLSVGEQFGGRFTAGMWFDAEESLGLEATFFFLNDRSAGFRTGTGNAVNQDLISFPFSNSLLVLTPVTTTITTRTTTTSPAGTTTTTATTSTTSSTPNFNTFPTFVIRQSTANLAGTSTWGLWGVELNGRCASPSLGAVSGLFGFRYLHFHDDLQVANSVHLFLPPGTVDLNGVGQPLDTNLPTNINYATTDVVPARNDFYGPQLGLDLDMNVGRFIADIRAKAALGVMHETVNFLGTTTLPNGTTVAGGLLSSATDIGSHSRNLLAFVPEINVKLGYMITPGLRTYVGYDFMYLSSVVRPGDQTGVASSGVQVTVAGTPNPITVSQPAFRYKDTDIVINGVNFGLEFRY